MSFAQLGFWSIGSIDGKPVYLMLLLGPLIMGALLFGPLMGAILGLFAGVVVYVHSKLLALDFYEVYFMTQLNTLVLLTIIGALAGWLFQRVLRSNPQGPSRFMRIAVVCLVLSFLTSGLVQLNTIIYYGEGTNIDTIFEYLICSPLGVVVQALVDALLMFVLCLVAEAAVRLVSIHASERTLHSHFGSLLLFVSLIVFMLAGATIFTLATLQSQDSAQDSLVSEATYLAKQLNVYEANADKFFDGDEAQEERAEHQRAYFEDTLDGYEVKSDGWVVVTDDQGTIIASDDEDWFAPGASFLKLIGYYDDVDFLESVTSATERDDATIIQASGNGNALSLDIMYLSTAKFDGGYVVMMYDSGMIFKDRFAIMVASTSLAILLIVAVALAAARLLNQIVIRRIDEMNVSLGKITEGDLSERVHVRASREFASLSAGINTTVSALRESIAEAEQKNAQELATAKAIQESALPTDFPAFPDIDAFDLYASMKTAKEVGGDFYDFFQIEGATKVGLVMADVSGKGVPAALFMMTAKTQVRTYMESGIPIDEAINAANHQLCLSNDAGMFVTMVACVLDYETGELTYVNAGHNPPLIQHDGSWSWMREVSGMPLGLFDGIPYDLIARQLEANDMLYFYTDGVTEAMNADGALFEEGRLVETLTKDANLNARSVCVGVRRAITDFTLDCEQSDDITMMSLKYGVPPEEKAVMVLDANDNQLVHVINYVHAELHRRHAPKSVYNQVDIAVEELFVNVCHYAYPEATPDNPGEVRICFEYDPNPPSLTVQISDDGIPYNPLAKPDAVTPDDIAEVPIGGLGILMAKKSVDEMSYERVGESNVLTFKKIW